MTFHVPSFLLGYAASFIFAVGIVLVLELVDRWQARKDARERDEALDQLLTEVGVACATKDRETL